MRFDHTLPPWDPQKKRQQSIGVNSLIFEKFAFVFKAFIRFNPISNGSYFVTVTSVLVSIHVGIVEYCHRSPGLTLKMTELSAFTNVPLYHQNNDNDDELDCFIRK